MSEKKGFSQILWKHKWMMPVVVVLTGAFHATCVYIARRAGMLWNITLTLAVKMRGGGGFRNTI